MAFLLIFFALGLGDLAWWRAADRRLRPLPRAAFWRTALGLMMGGQLGYLLLTILAPQLTRRSHGGLPMPLHAAVFLWHLIVLPVSGMLMLAALAARSAGQLVARVRPAPMPQPGHAAPGLTRRQVLAVAAVAAPPLVTAGLSVFAVARLRDLRVRRLDVVLPQLPPALEGTTLALVSDIHVGKFTRAGTLPALADRVNGLRADFVVVAGDLIDMALADLPAALDTVRRFDPRHGLFISEGNHDLIENGREFERRMKQSGLPFLLREERTIEFRGEPLQFLGAPWVRGQAATTAALQLMTPLLRPGVFSILLAHHPHFFDDAAGAGIPLTLSGHTHGGQIMLTDKLGAGPALFRYWSGLYTKQTAMGRSSLVVSNGAGNWFPLRLNAPEEVVHITLRRES